MILFTALLCMYVYLVNYYFNRSYWNNLGIFLYSLLMTYFSDGTFWCVGRNVRKSSSLCSCTTALAMHSTALEQAHLLLPKFSVLNYFLSNFRMQYFSREESNIGIHLSGKESVLYLRVNWTVAAPLFLALTTIP